jgi:para-nitrobenzyl esterase
MVRKVMTALFCAGLALCGLQAEVKAGPSIAIADTEAGKLQGFVRNGIFTFRGVQYATSERFGAPQKVPKWEGIKSALSYGPISPMAPMDTVAQDEFFNAHRYWPQNEVCQYLNIWTQGIKDGKKRPVMVWLHGGGHSNGSSIEGQSYDGENLSRRGDVVVVSLNHRLNVVGYLDLSAYGDKYKDSVNVGSKDIVAALQWIHDNIAEFGGDPNNVTLFGQSGGGSKVVTMMASPSAKGLFQRGIAESGGSGAFLNQSVSRRVAELTLQNLGITAEQIDQIKTVPYLQLLDAGTKAVAAAAKELGTGANWGPVVDGKFIPFQNDSAEFNAQTKNITLMIGSVFVEQGTIQAAGKDAMWLEANDKNTWDAARTKAELVKRFGAKADAVAAAFAKAYPNKKLADAAFFNVRTGVVNYAADRAKLGGAPVYNYLFTWESPILDGVAMSYHCSELPFVFYNTQVADTATGGGKEALALSAKMSQAWINFARNGNPNASGLPAWKPFDAANGGTMIFDNACAFKAGYDNDLLAAATP